MESYFDDSINIKDYQPISDGSTSRIWDNCEYIPEYLIALMLQVPLVLVLLTQIFITKALTISTTLTQILLTLA